MAKTRIIKRQDRAYMELPPEMAKYDEVEFFLLRDGYYLISPPLGSSVPEQKVPPTGDMSEKERTVLKKLLSIKFENRTPAYVSKMFSDSERETLGDLEQKKLINLFKGRKYVDGVYNIPDSTYSLVQRPDSRPSVPQTSPSQSMGTIAVLNSKGFVIIQDKREAFAFSEESSRELKSGAVIGVKGFDGKFYAVSREYFSTAKNKITAILKKDMDLPSIASTTKLDPDGCTAVLRLMAENGDIIEKKRGVFAPV
ncbi:Uncharacterised protein [Candidatus Bilamarchaeum dharawalense]|uniref:Uncharacterized protein n=1 Tax=Candidatus Bilamarchaeum dharawalense TaxID=2885759 RepID=A0A5E4LU74_9ARCH|nr:Uncharacterised protein [Candidatus Bilamarchaeum dharawalense]